MWLCKLFISTKTLHYKWSNLQWLCMCGLIAFCAYKCTIASKFRPLKYKVTSIKVKFIYCYHSHSSWMITVPGFPLIILVENYLVKFSEYVKNWAGSYSTNALHLGWSADWLAWIASGVPLSRLVPLTSLLAGTAPGEMDTCRIPLLVFVYAEKVCGEHWEKTKMVQTLKDESWVSWNMAEKPIWLKITFSVPNYWSPKCLWKPRRSALLILYPLRWWKLSRKNTVF